MLLHLRGLCPQRGTAGTVDRCKSLETKGFFYGSPIHGFGNLAGKLPEFRKLAEEAGRDPAELEVSIFGVGPRAEDVESYRAAGAQRVVFALPPAGRDKVLPLLDRYRELVEQLG